MALIPSFLHSNLTCIWNVGTSVERLILDESCNKQCMFYMLKRSMMDAFKCFEALSLFIAARAIFQLSGDCHHYRWQGCKFRPVLSTHGFQQWGFFYVPHLLRHRTSVYTVSSEAPLEILSEHQLSCFIGTVYTAQAFKTAHMLWFKCEADSVLCDVYESACDLWKVGPCIPGSIFAYAKHCICYITLCMRGRTARTALQCWVPSCWQMWRITISLNVLPDPTQHSQT
jgi:hypothetical protein